MITKENVETYIKTINLPTDNIIILVSEICDYIASLNTDEISNNAEALATLFCITISKIQAKELDYEELSGKIMTAFNNIKSLVENERQYLCTYIITLRLLKKLNDMVDKEQDFNAIDDEMHTQFDELSENLEQMKVIFKIKINGKEVFPIGKLLAGVIGSERFKIDVLDVKTLNTLLLALEIFNSSEYTKENVQLRKLIDDCDIKCLKYLENAAVKKFDENSWKINFQKNGVLILADLTNRKVLIRHEDQSYFSSLSDSEFKNVRDEKNKDGRRIASYYEYEFGTELVFDSIKGILLSKNIKRIINLLKTVYNQKNYNTFYYDAFFRNGDEVKPVNMFTFNDKTIVMGNREENTFSASVNNVTYECIRKYWMEILIDNGMNIATVGLLCNLLTMEDVDVELFCESLNDDEFYQNQIIRNWALLSECPYESLKKVQDKFFNTFRYLQSQNDMTKQSFSELFLYPYEFDSSLVNRVLLNSYDSLKEDDIDYLKVTYKTNFQGEKDGIVYNGDNIVYNDIIYDDSNFMNDEELYAIKTSEGKWMVHGLINDLGKIHNKIINGNKKLLTYSTVNIFHSTQIQYVIDFMNLHKYSLLDQDVKINNESMMKLRLIHNIIFYQIITTDRWNKFLNILGCHEKISYDFISSTGIDFKESGVLFVPKERQESDSALTSIFNTYLRSYQTRNPDLYYDEIEYRDGEGKYYIRGDEIKKVVFIFDTLQSGTSTKRTLGFYFENYEETAVDGVPNRSQRYYANKQQIKLETIVKNNCASVVIYFMYGSMIGKERIKAYCEEVGKGHDVLNNAEIICFKEIKAKVDQGLITLCEELYSKCNMNLNEYPVIREFNQPKRNVFPKEMLKADCIFSLFVQKKELIS